MEKSVHFSDLSGQMIQDEAQLATITVVEHPDIEEPVKLEAMPDELEQLGKLAMSKPVVLEVQMPGDEDPQRHILTATNFAKLSADKPIGEVLQGAEPVKLRRRIGGAAVNGEQRDHNSIEWAGTPHKGKTSPEEARMVRDNLEAINARLAEQGHRTIDPKHPDHARRYGFVSDAS